MKRNTQMFGNLLAPCDGATVAIYAAVLESMLYAAARDHDIHLDIMIKKGDKTISFKIQDGSLATDITG